ncbi:cupin domain-containing protein [Flammeovirga sp. OC4]|uniref:cupin domain-containing protein n=1 Tax=Flammeovirga sp. OC4 TaxID=1382345 RepID=UPI0005C5864A|nr:cupin domain-containing protein [Flammeovirga sp. OC4]
MKKLVSAVLLLIFSFGCKGVKVGVNENTSDPFEGKRSFNDFMTIQKNHSIYNEKTLTELPSWPEEYKIHGDLRQWEKVVYKGEELVGAIWMSKSGKLKVDGYPYDQFVLVIEGKVTLQPEGEKEKTYFPGDVFFVPKNYAGTWDMPSDYKELIVVERKAWDTFGE